jgi:hypothetical protein
MRGNAAAPVSFCLRIIAATKMIRNNGGAGSDGKPWRSAIPDRVVSFDLLAALSSERAEARRPFLPSIAVIEQLN